MGAARAGGSWPRHMGDGGGSGGRASSGGEFQTARRGFVLIFVLHVSCVFFKR